MLAWVLFGYAVGSVPFAFLVARRAGIDVRVSGSGNVGAANVLRTSGTALGVAAMLLDMSKGAATVLAAHVGAGTLGTTAAAGTAAVVGHIYPVWLRFHGGKGVAVAAGVFGVLAPLATAVAGLVFIAVVWWTRVVSLGSIAATLTLPSVVWFAGGPADLLVAAAGTSALILFRHRSNVRRLVAGSERRIGDRVR
jgi:acyl phosphate:glycerol-3-phosphate acyltransferase